MAKKYVVIMDVLNNGVGYADSHEATIPAEAFERAAEVYQAMVDGSLETGVDPVTGNLLSAMAEATSEATADPSAEATEAE